MFSTLLKTNFNFSVTFILSSANGFNLDQSQILSSGNGLTMSHLGPLSCTKIISYCLLFNKKIQEIIFLKPIPTQSHLLTPLANKPFENTVGKGEIARNEHFLLCPVFSTLLENFSAIFIKSKIVVCKTLSIWRSLKFVVWERVNPLLHRYSF